MSLCNRLCGLVQSLVSKNGRPPVFIRLIVFTIRGLHPNSMLITIPELYRGDVMVKQLK